MINAVVGHDYVTRWAYPTVLRLSKDAKCAILREQLVVWKVRQLYVYYVICVSGFRVRNLDLEILQQLTEEPAQQRALSAIPMAETVIDDGSFGGKGLQKCSLYQESSNSRAFSLFIAVSIKTLRNKTFYDIIELIAYINDSQDINRLMKRSLLLPKRNHSKRNTA